MSQSYHVEIWQATCVFSRFSMGCFRNGRIGKFIPLRNQTVVKCSGGAELKNQKHTTGISLDRYKSLSEIIFPINDFEVLFYGLYYYAFTNEIYYDQS